MTLSRKQQGYVVAVMASIAVLATRLAFHAALAEQALLLPFVLAVVAAAWWGGLGPGLLATAFSVLSAALLLIPPVWSLKMDSLAQALNAAIFTVVGITISLLCEALHASQRRDAEQQFRTLADSIPQLAWMARPDGYRFWFNKRWYEYTGATPDAMEGDGWQRVYDSRDLPRSIESWNTSIRTGQPWEETVRLHRSDGVVRWHLCRALPLKNAAGNIVCWFGTNTDITDRQEMEEVLKSTNQRKDEFLATLGHELRNPLAPISNALQLWPLVENDKSQMDQLRAMMQRQVKQMTRLIDDLMDVSRISHGKIRIQRQPIDVRDAVAQAIETARPLLDARGHDLHLKLAPQPMIVDGDLARLTQVFGNLLNNAGKYTSDHGSIWLTVEPRGSSVSISVRDNGPGIPRPMLSQIFELFRQVEGTVARSHGGLGIGLTLVKQLVELHGGTIEARSEGAGQGSEFVVTLPRLADPPGGFSRPMSENQPAQAQLPRHSILVVDDNRESANTLALMLRAMGQDVRTVFEPATVVDALVAHPVDLVLLDIAMPGMDGYEVARRIRQHHELDDVLLVALTGYGQEDDRHQAFAAGFDRFMTKPAGGAAMRQLLATMPATLHAGKLP